MSENIWINEYNPFNKYKILAWYQNLKAIKTGNFLPPVNIPLDLVNGTQENKQCGGLNCNFCMSSLSEKEKVCKIPKDFLLTMPEFFYNWGVKSLCIAGNHSDPCMYNHEDLIEFLRLCKQFNIEIGFVTNGAGFSDKLLEEVARNCIWCGFSVNAGTSIDHSILTNTKEEVFYKIINNIKKLSDIVKKYKLNHQVGYKFLITETNYMHILDAIKIAKESGVRHVQIRPCELPIERSKLIDTKLVEEQIKEGLKLEVPNKFEIFGIREKFTSDFTKKPPKRCIASPLASTWRADGQIVVCSDRRWSHHLPNMTLGNFLEEGLEAIRRKWGGTEHRKMIEEANKHLDDCIRCTFYKYHEIYEECIEKDNLDMSLI